MLEGSALQPEIHSLIEAKDFATLKSTLADMEVHDLGELLVELKGEDLALCFRLLSRDRAAEIAGELDAEHWEALVKDLSSERVAAILNEMSPDDRTWLLEELPGELAQRLLATLKGDESKIARSLLAYPEDSIGRLMTPEYVAVRPDWSVEQILEHLRKVGHEVETLNVLYVTDRHWKLLGEVTLEGLVLAESAAPAEGIMEEVAGVLTATDDEESAVEVFKKYDALALPVVNSQGVLVGIVTVDDVMDVAEEEDTEDMQRMAGMLPLEASYLSSGHWPMLRKRLPWLALLLAGQTLTAVALLGFHSVPLFAVLVMFVPLINSPAGNAGTQVAGLMIRSLALQELDLADWRRVLVRELLRGMTFGLVLAGLGFLAALMFASVVDTGPYRPRHIAVAVCCAMLVAVTLGNVIGAMLPFFFKRIGLDPAVTSGPFIASLMDVSGIMVYFGLAMLVFAMVV